MSAERPSQEDPDRLFGQGHVDRYRETDGEVGHEWRGTTVLILTTTGRRSGESRSTPLIYRERGADRVVVASNGGSAEPPGWFRNLDADPSVEVQVLEERFPARARVATDEERRELWPRMTEVWPDYDDYQARTERQIPIVVLERA